MVDSLLPNLSNMPKEIKTAEEIERELDTVRPDPLPDERAAEEEQTGNVDADTRG